MVTVTDYLFSHTLSTFSILVFVPWLSWISYWAVYNLFFHPLARFPGPKTAAATDYWKTFVELVQGRSLCNELVELHAKYGDVVRVAPNELHFGQPRAYHDIHNNKNRWDKDWKLYHCFSGSRSSFGFITYKEARDRKDVLNRSFSPKAIEQAQSIIVEQIDAMCAAFARSSANGTPVDLYLAYRCLTIDVITSLCFGESIKAIDQPGFRAPLVEAMDASLPVFVQFKHFELYRKLILNCPTKLAQMLTPETKGLADLQQFLLRKIQGLTDNPKNLDKLAHKYTIYHRLIDPQAYPDGKIPSPGSLYAESQTMVFGGADTTANALMFGSFHLLRNRETYDRLKKELEDNWPRLEEPPSLRKVESLKYLDAVIKESLRISTGVPSGLLRVVPAQGATICGVQVPGEAIVSCGSTFVHFNSDIFPEPYVFRPERWLNRPDLENWLVPFSRGPRMCLGINLAWAELRLTFAHVFRKFEMRITDDGPENFPYRDCFLPYYYGAHLEAFVQPVH